MNGVGTTPFVRGFCAAGLGFNSSHAVEDARLAMPTHWRDGRRMEWQDALLREGYEHEHPEAESRPSGSASIDHRELVGVSQPVG